MTTRRRKNVTAAELKPFVRSSCWVRLQSVVELRGGGRLGQGRLQLRSYEARYNCDLILELVWTNQRSTDAHCQLRPGLLLILESKAYKHLS